MDLPGSHKIPENIRPIPRTPVDNRPARPAETPKAAAAPPPAAEVTISPAAVLAQSLAAQVAQTPEVRPDAVAQAQAEVRSQAPLAPAAKVAEKLLTQG
jgi:hypothetical protein